MPPATRTKDLHADRAARPTDSPADKYPSLRTAMWLYLLVLCATAALIIGFSYNIDPLFLRFSAALLIAGAFTVFATYLSRVKLVSIVGRNPSIVSLITSLLAGVVVGIPSFWLGYSVSLMLDSNIGILPLLQSQASDTARLLQIGFIIPLCQGLLFWAFIESAAVRANRRWGVPLVALMYIFYGLFDISQGIRSGIALLPVGLMAAYLVAYTGSAWYGIALAMGVGLSSLYVPPLIFSFIGPDQFGSPLSIGWLLIVVISAFVAFICYQIARLRSPAEPVEPVPQRRYWWAPLILSIAIVALIVTSEITLRQSTYRRRPQPVPTQSSTGSTSPPIPATVPPTPGAAR